MEGQINETNRFIQISDAEAKDLEAENQKLKGDSSQFQKAHQNEISKNQDLNSKIANQENTSKGKELKLNDLLTEMDVLKRAHSAATDTYGHLREEIDNVKQQIHIMEQNNEEVIL